MSQNVPKSKERKKLGKAVRRNRIIALIVEGKAKSNQQIADVLGVDEKTIDRDMGSVQIQDFVHGLVKRQIEDIEASDKPNTRLHFRSDLLDKLIPKAMKMEQHIEGGDSFRVEIVDNSKDPESDAKTASSS